LKIITTALCHAVSLLCVFGGQGVWALASEVMNLILCALRGQQSTRQNHHRRREGGRGEQVLLGCRVKVTLA
jgi:hypothetical protein